MKFIIVVCMVEKNVDSQIKRYSTSIKIDPELWKEAKKTAIDTGITVSELIEKAIKEWLKKQRL